MFLARVTGNVVSTVKTDTLTAKKILILQPIDSQGNDRGAKLLALDSVGAGAGETVYYCRGREASFPWYPDDVPVDATIVGIVDRVNVKQESEVRRQESGGGSQKSERTREKRAPRVQS